MVTTKAYLDKVIENHQQFVQSFTEYTDKTLEAVVIDRELTAKGMELFQEFFIRPYEMMDGWTKKEQLELMQNDFWAVYLDRMTRSSDISANLFNKGMEFMQLMSRQYNLPSQQERMRRISEAFQTMMDSYRKTLEEDAEVSREFINIK
jgi:hypothetical protein